MITITRAENGRAGKLARLPFPWEADPYRLVSLLEMLQFYAESFFISLTILKNIKTTGIEFWGGVASIDNKMDQLHFRVLDETLRELETVCKVIELGTSLSQIGRMRDQRHHVYTYRQ